MEVEHDMRRGRETSVDTLPAYPGPAVIRDSRETIQERGVCDAKECLEGRSLCSEEGEWEFGFGDDGEKKERVPTMDWSGMEWLRGVYAERKSRMQSFCPRDEFEKTDEEI